MKIYQALVNIMSEIGSVAKTGWNEKQRYHFRKADDVVSALQPMLVKHGVVVVPKVIDDHYTEKAANSGSVLIYRTLKVEYTFFHVEDQSFLTAIVVGEGCDSGDKASNKAMTAAYKYAVCQVLCIPTDEIKDSEKDSHEFGQSIFDSKKAFDMFNFVSKAKKVGISEEVAKKLAFAYDGRAVHGIDAYLEQHKTKAQT